MIAVLGGGITGLAAAYRLTERLGPGSCVVLEAGDAPGGKIRTSRVQGMLLEDGPDAFLAAKPQAAELCRALGLGSELVATEPAARRAFVRRGDDLWPLPTGLTGLVPAQVWPMVSSPALSLPGKLRAALEVAMPRGGAAEESVAGFVTRRFGREVWDRLAEPLLAGISAGDGDQMSLQAMFPRLAQMEQTHRSVVLGGLRARPSAAAAPASGFLTLRGGLDGLVTALAARIGADALHMNTRISALTRAGGRWSIASSVGAIAADAVIVALPAPAAAPVVREQDAALAGLLDSIHFTSSVVVNLAWPRRALGRPLAGSGWVVPAAEQSPAIAVSVSSNKFPGRAPDDTVLLRVFLGRRGESLLSLDNDTLIAQALAEAVPRLRLSGAPVFRRIVRWSRALPLYSIGHRERVADMEARAAQHDGLVLAGCSYRGAGIPDCIVDGFAAADRVAARVRAAA
jgi:oxygen-dependent protoporphyrinogen oxidase